MKPDIVFTLPFCFIRNLARKLVRVKYACADYRKQLCSENRLCNSAQGGLIMAVSSYYNNVELSD